MEPISRSLFYPSPGPSVWTTAVSFYTRSYGLEKMRLTGNTTRDDTTDTMERSFSADNGETWSEPEVIEFISREHDGVHRSYAQPGFVDPVRDRLLSMLLVGRLPTDDPLEGMRQWHLWYSVSGDGGRTKAVEEQVIQEGDYDHGHPCRGVWTGRNSIMIGDSTCRPIRTRCGEILVPVQVTPVGPGGEYHNPGGGYTYHDSAVLIGRWRNDHLSWEFSDYLSNDPSRSTRGALEPTLAEMPDGRILMVLRGSNDVRPDLPGFKWFSVSGDGGRTWREVKPWTYDDGSRFYSPSSCSQLLEHSNGSFYWIGNLTPQNPSGNRPRYPLVIGEVDPESCLLRMKSTEIIQSREPGQPREMSLSNFMAHEDRATGDIIVNMSPLFTRKYPDWTGDAYLYRITP